MALEEKRVRAGSPQEAKLQEELKDVTRGLDTFDSRILGRYGGFENAGRRYREFEKYAGQTHAA